ncbi:hypothetical protein MRX96_021627 [Rhipicephalus microplus]
MDCLPPPESLVLTNTPADNWKKFRQRIELYFKATETNKKRTPAQKAAIFLHVAGPEAIEKIGAVQTTCFCAWNQRFAFPRPLFCDGIDHCGDGTDEPEDCESRNRRTWIEWAPLLSWLSVYGLFSAVLFKVYSKKKRSILVLRNL